MNFKKTILSMGTIASAAAPIAATVACGGTQEDAKAKFVASTFVPGAKATEVVSITDGGNKADKSFNEQGWAAAETLISGTQTTTPSNTAAIIEAGSTSASEISKAYEQALGAHKKTLILSGFNHVTPLTEFSAKHADMAFVLIDGAIQAEGKDQGNVASLNFLTGQASFIAGYQAAHALAVDVVKTVANRTLGNKDGTAKIAAFGGMNIPSVTAFIKGFKAGVAFYNAHKIVGNTTEVVFEEAGFMGNFDADKDGAVTTKTQALVKGGADMILPVGGPQAVTVVKEVAKDTAHAVKVIGVDTDLSANTSLSGQNETGAVFSSILKNIASSAVETVKALYATTDPTTGVVRHHGKEVLGHNYVGGLNEGWVGVAGWPTSNLTPDQTLVQTEAKKLTY